MITKKGLRFLTKTRTSVARSSGNKAQIGAFCKMAKHLLSLTPDREFHVTDPKQAALIFTDGAYEENKASAGAVIFDRPDLDMRDSGARQTVRALA